MNHELAIISKRIDWEAVKLVFAEYSFADNGDPSVSDSQKYNDGILFPDKVRLNRYYLHHYSIWIDIKIIFATVLGKRIWYGGEVI